MNEAMIVEAIRAAQPSAAQADSLVTRSSSPVTGVADPSAVSRFQAAMGIDGTQEADPIPFASEATAAWRSAQVNNQGILHRIRALSQMSAASLSAPEMIELQYEVANLAFQQEIVTKVADKSSNAIQTLIKNQ